MINDFYIYLIYLFFALIPAIFWSYFYLKKDTHPEPKEMVLKVFILGMLSACLAAVFEILVLKIIPDKSFLTLIIESFVLVAFVEEFVKFMVVRIYVLDNPELDEPFDVMLYMVIAALGFATLENIVLFFGTEHPQTVGIALSFALLRFLGAVFLHTLTSGILGFFMARSFYLPKNKNLFLCLGFLLAIFFHGIYNITILEFYGIWQYFILASVIIVLTVFTTWCFINLKKLKSICEIK